MSAAREPSWIWGLYTMLGGRTRAPPTPGPAPPTPSTPAALDAVAVTSEPTTLGADAEAVTPETAISETVTLEPGEIAEVVPEPAAVVPEPAAVVPAVWACPCNEQMSRMLIATDLLNARIAAVKRKRDLAELNDAKAEFELQKHQLQTDN